jgi:hypothetical protein
MVARATGHKHDSAAAFDGVSGLYQTSQLDPLLMIGIALEYSSISSQQ